MTKVNTCLKAMQSGSSSRIMLIGNILFTVAVLQQMPVASAHVVSLKHHEAMDADAAMMPYDDHADLLEDELYWDRMLQTQGSFGREFPPPNEEGRQSDVTAAPTTALPTSLPDPFVTETPTTDAPTTSSTGATTTSTPAPTISTDTLTSPPTTAEPTATPTVTVTTERQDIFPPAPVTFLSFVNRDRKRGGLGKCEGDCNRDADCASGLLCFRRATVGGWRNMIVPGCTPTSEDPRRRVDYCYDPRDANGAAPAVISREEEQPTPTDDTTAPTSSPTTSTSSPTTSPTVVATPEETSSICAAAGDVCLVNGITLPCCSSDHTCMEFPNGLGSRCVQAVPDQLTTSPTAVATVATPTAKPTTASPTASPTEDTTKCPIYVDVTCENCQKESANGDECVSIVEMVHNITNKGSEIQRLYQVTAVRQNETSTVNLYRFIPQGLADLAPGDTLTLTETVQIDKCKDETFATETRVISGPIVELVAELSCTTVNGEDCRSISAPHTHVNNLNCFQEVQHSVKIENLGESAANILTLERTRNDEFYDLMPWVVNDVLQSGWSLTINEPLETIDICKRENYRTRLLLQQAPPPQNLCEDIGFYV